MSANATKLMSPGLKYKSTHVSFSKQAIQRSCFRHLIKLLDTPHYLYLAVVVKGLEHHA